MEFWAVIGLACLDRVFLRQLQEHPDDLQSVVREYGFRLSRWEMGELVRVMSLPGAADRMMEICMSFWENAFNPIDMAPCWWSAERSEPHDDLQDDPYCHPLVNGEPVWKPGGHGFRAE